MRTAVTIFISILSFGFVSADPDPAQDGICDECAGATWLQCNPENDPSNDCVCFTRGAWRSCSAANCCQSQGTCCDEENNPFPAYYSCTAGNCDCTSGIDCKDGPTCCPGFNVPAGRRLRETAENILREGDEEYDITVSQLADLCSEEEYNVALYIEHGHIFSIASPANKEVQGCHHVAVHSVFSVDKSLAKKEVLLWSTDHHISSSKTYPMGTFKVFELIAAFEEVKAYGEGDYNYLGNNCATMHLNIAKRLDIKIDAEVVSFVARRLWEDSGKALVDKIKASMISNNFLRRQLVHSGVTARSLLQMVIQENAGLA